MISSRIVCDCVCVCIKSTKYKKRIWPQKGSQAIIMSFRPNSLIVGRFNIVPYTISQYLHGAPLNHLTVIGSAVEANRLHRTYIRSQRRPRVNARADRRRLTSY